MYLKNSFILILFLVLSCQPVEILKPIEIDTSNLEKISINAKKIEINKKYNSVFSQNNIEDQIQKSPIDLMVEWNNKNILKIGNENKLVINILDASITKNEIENVDAKKYEEKTIFKYELFYLVEYELYDSSGFLIANTTVETSRSTTSQKYISLNETEIIINDLLILAMRDYINETKNQLSIYMGDYLSI
ncbi:MAG: hypothetical protein CM15mP57_3700 [Alphaproteobacteria bacterium]|nr:MAG: hypothetical protein CM15mP57_3700 [Alphaproteobacteria bacterium]